MFSLFESLRSSFQQTKRGNAAGEKRLLSRKDGSKEPEVVIHSPPRKRVRDDTEDLDDQDKSVVFELFNKAMYWAEKYNFWKKQQHPKPQTSRVICHIDDDGDDDVICTGVVKRKDNLNLDNDDGVIFLGEKPSQVGRVHTTIRSTQVTRDPLGLSSKPTRHQKSVSLVSVGQTDHTGRAHVSVDTSQQYMPLRSHNVTQSGKRSFSSQGDPDRTITSTHSLSQSRFSYDPNKYQRSFTVGHNDSKSQGRIRIGPSKPPLRRVPHGNRHKTRGEGVVRLREKELYQQLLSQFTDRAAPLNGRDKDETKENVSLGQTNNISMFEIPDTAPTIHTHRLRKSDYSVLSPWQPTPLQSTIHHSTPVYKVIASPTRVNEPRSHIEDIKLFSRPAPCSPVSSNTCLSPRSTSQRVDDDPLLNNWTKKWRNILSPENQAREREQERISLEEKKLQVLREKRIQEEQSAIQEVQDRIQKEQEPEEEEDEHFIPLSEDMEQMVDRALGPGNPTDELVEGFKVTITRGDLSTLNNLNWLNDEVINFYFSMIMERSNQEGYPKVHIFNSFFYPKLVKTGHASLKRWTRKVDVFAVDLILVPIHLGMHWCLAAVDFRKKTITYYDSLKGSNTQCLQAIGKYLKDESLDKKKQPFDMTGWTSSCPKEIPEQLNGCDCGVFACTYAEYLSRNAKFTFDQYRMPYIRRRMVYEILTKTLM